MYDSKGKLQIGQMKDGSKAFISCSNSLLFGLSGDTGCISKSLYKSSDLMTHPFAYENE